MTGKIRLFLAIVVFPTILICLAASYNTIPLRHGIAATNAPGETWCGACHRGASGGNFAVLDWTGLYTWHHGVSLIWVFDAYALRFSNNMTTVSGNTSAQFFSYQVTFTNIYGNGVNVHLTSSCASGTAHDTTATGKKYSETVTPDTLFLGVNRFGDTVTAGACAVAFRVLDFAYQDTIFINVCMVLADGDGTTLNDQPFCASYPIPYAPPLEVTQNDSACGPPHPPQPKPGPDWVHTRTFDLNGRNVPARSNTLQILQFEQLGTGKTRFIKQIQHD